QYFLLFLFIFLGHVAVAQQVPATTDSSKIYRDIEKYSKKRKSTRFIHGIFFKPVNVPVERKTKTKKRKNLLKPYREVEGKIIREIHIETLDPFGYSVTDTIAVPQNYLYKAGNNLHVKSLR